MSDSKYLYIPHTLFEKNRKLSLGARMFFIDLLEINERLGVKKGDCFFTQINNYQKIYA